MRIASPCWLLIIALTILAGGCKKKSTSFLMKLKLILLITVSNTAAHSLHLSQVM
jgi:hypothetical protein